MKACIQRVQWARVKVNGEVVGEIKKGLLILLGVAIGDTEKEAKILAEKTAQLRIFEDEQGKMNLSLAEVGGAVLVVSQFTLLADCRKGRRPSFTKAAPPEDAERLVNHFLQLLRAQGLPVATGRFREHMAVELLNDGPVTILLDSDELSRPRRAGSGVVE
ncbi:D-aminoacyl-tRNA deacylase [Thermogutta sp.]|uniref:D-aminoacyl-tRNA deacylase n=1 Tax=Thermogutta sp. TaxID=1962930 RepID=UPI00321FEF00